ncbi:NAD(P)/FAD-dependent oxidoreductase [Rhodococcus aerolatus]
MTATAVPVPPTVTLPEHVRTLVVGAGFAGMAVAATLLRDDPDADLLVLERATDVGGTWRDNTYPGCACDVPTALYSFSFAPNPSWSHTYGRQPEIFAYLRNVATSTGIRERVVFDCPLVEARWDADAQQYRVLTTRGELTCDVLVVATGTLSEPKLPDVPGLPDFRGTTFHSARWDHEHDLTGERVAVVGTGASAVQFVPEIADTAGSLTVFQRTPGWVIPRLDRTLSRAEKALYHRFPKAQRAMRGLVYSYRELYILPLAKFRRLLPLIGTVARTKLRVEVRDAGLRDSLTPDYTVGCKRLLLTNAWLPTLDRDDVELVTTGLSAVTPTGVVDGDGTEREVDTIIFATGFTPTEPPVAHQVRGSDGRTLAEHWDGSPSAHRGTTVAGFPNLFLMYGPNTNLGHSSIVYMLESQARYVADALRTMASRRLGEVEVRDDAERGWNASMQKGLRRTVWNAGGCASWYFDKTGRNSAMWPTFTWRFRRATRRFDVESYRTAARRTREEVAA